MKFSKEEKQAIVKKIQMYFHEELDQEIGGFDAEFLLDFFVGEIGHFFYNRALYDVQELLQSQFDSMTDSIFTLEKFESPIT